MAKPTDMITEVIKINFNELGMFQNKKCVKKNSSDRLNNHFEGRGKGQKVVYKLH